LLTISWHRKILNMEENNRVIVFEKKEIILILIFVLVLLVTSFTLGIRFGKKLGADINPEVKETVVAPEVSLESPEEEAADKALAESQATSDEEKLLKLTEQSKEELSKELAKFSEDKMETTPASDPSLKTSSTMIGKFTIQLGSYNTADEARQFAEGFTVRGYSPIINEVSIPDKGVWYRVSLGIFKTVEEAKAYIKTEQSLFQGQDYVITEIR
jgi:cell division septation protein DedD